MTKNTPGATVAVGDPAQIIRYPDTSRFADKMQKAIFKLTTSVSAHCARGRLFLHSFARARPYCAQEMRTMRMSNEEYAAFVDSLSPRSPIWGDLLLSLIHI